MAPRLLSLLPFPRETVAAMLGRLADRIELSVLAERSPAGLRSALADDGGPDLVLASWQGTDPLPFDTAAVAAAGPRLAFVQQPSVGVDSLDVGALAARGVPVANTAGANARAVAEWCLAGALAQSRSLLWADCEVRAGRWPQLEVAARGSTELSGLRAGILGMGAIGLEVARLLQVFGGEVSYWTRTPRPPEATHGAVWRELDEVITGSDLLVSVLPLTDETRGLVDPRRMPSGAILVDAGRGGVVQPAALLEALDGHLHGAALDVFDTEPLPVDHPLRHHDRVLLSPHCAGGSRQASFAIIAAAVANLRRVLDGEPVQDVVNGLDPYVTLRAADSR